MISAIELQARREALGLSQAELAKRLEIDEWAVVDWEFGAAAIPDDVRQVLDELEEQLRQLVVETVDAIYVIVDAGEPAPPILVDLDVDVVPAGLRRVAAAHALFQLAANEIETEIRSAATELGGNDESAPRSDP